MLTAWEFAAWGAFGAAAVEVLEFYGALRRTGDWPWATRGLRLSALGLSVIIRVAAGLGLAFAAGVNGQIDGALGAVVIGVAAPLIIEKLAQQTLLEPYETASPSTTLDAGSHVAAAIRRDGPAFSPARRDLIAADLRSAQMPRADLAQSDLCGADLRNADLTGANLRGADLRSADLRRAVLSAAQLHDANLSGANLSGAFLSGVILTGADMTGADLSGADLGGADIQGAILSRALWTASTSWPTHLQGTIRAASDELPNATFRVRL